MGFQTGIEGSVYAGQMSNPNNLANQLDCETAALLRAVIRPVFEGASSWTTLMDTLRVKGYRLAFREGRLCITDRTTGDRVCGLRFLGLDLRDLVGRLGRPIVVARPGAGADGDLLITRPGMNAKPV